MKSVYFIPTNRNVERCLRSYVKEIVYAKDNFNLNIPLIVVETNNEDFVQHNHAVVEELKVKYPDIEIIHLTTDIQKKYFDKVFEGMDSVYEDFFLYDKVNYGTAMNKLALFTCSMGADSFHRRDSDTCLIFDEFKDAKELYPIEVELKYLGKKVKELREIDGVKIKPGIDEEKRLLVVGGNYFGEWNLDVKDFARESFDIIYRLYELIGFSKDSIEEICAEAFQFDKKLEQIEHLTLVTSANDGLNPDCGNVAVYKLLEYLPNVPGKNTLGADYFAFDTATALSLPSLHHTREVFHEYHSERFEPEKKMRYWYGLSKMTDYFNMYMSIYDGDFKDEHCDNDNVFISKDMCTKLIDHIKTFEFEDLYKRIERINQIADNVLMGFNDNYTKIALELKKNATNYINESNEDYKNHTLLFDKWDEIIKRAKSVNLREML